MSIKLKSKLSRLYKDRKNSPSDRDHDRDLLQLGREGIPSFGISSVPRAARNRWTISNKSCEYNKSKLNALGCRVVDAGRASVCALCLNLWMRCRNMRELSAQTWPKSGYHRAASSLYKQLRRKSQKKKLNEKCKMNHEKKHLFFGNFISLEEQVGQFGTLVFFGASMNCKCSACCCCLSKNLLAR